jgi:hypothetical protein
MGMKTFETFELLKTYFEWIMFLALGENVLESTKYVYRKKKRKFLLFILSFENDSP